MAETTDDRLRLLIERVERLEEEKKGIADDIRDVFAEGQWQLGLFFFALYYAAYFVWAARAMGKTLGLGLAGLRLENAYGFPPDARSLVYRQMGCLLQFATGGVLYLAVLRGTKQPLLQDRVSATRVVVDH